MSISQEYLNPHRSLLLSPGKHQGNPLPSWRWVSVARPDLNLTMWLRLNLIFWTLRAGMAGLYHHVQLGKFTFVFFFSVLHFWGAQADDVKYPWVQTVCVFVVSGPFPLSEVMLQASATACGEAQGVCSTLSGETNICHLAEGDVCQVPPWCS